MKPMRAVVLDVPKHWLEERARLGVDRWDELWEGVLHMVPPPTFLHQDMSTQLMVFLVPHLRLRGVGAVHETGVFPPGSKGDNYRIPDLLFFEESRRRELVSKRGIDGPPLAVLEIRSPNDETYEKFDFWAHLGVPEVIVIEPLTRSVEVHRLAGQRYQSVAADPQGGVHAATIDARFSMVDGPKLRVQYGADTIEI